MTLESEIPERCLCFDARRTSRLITRVYEQFLEPSGLTATQRGAMKFVEDRGALSIAELATLLDLDRTSLRRLLDPLERDGHITVVAGTDRRTRLVSLTEHGKTILGVSDQYWQQAQRKMLEMLGENHWRSLTTLMHSTRKIIHSRDSV
ncbi:MarR family winged helix-turn-helix transcriptional regulator [Paraburkholderia atlantica]|uniref:MarR family winged helix-turn-helix transcriptional regulator n=1 Tax=Paraburkholderia atlantica TaxID=2654982 RepID=UPI00187B9EE3|nr:MarR family transcriptional regulator [Paraburkholderia atlantica]